MRGLKTIASAAFLASLSASGSAFAAADPTGIWLNDTGRGAVEITECGDALCGKVVWVKNTADADGCGKQIIGNVKSMGGGRWDGGWIYSPERGRKYNVELTPLSNGNLRVTGYAGMRFLSKTMIWTKAPGDLQLCGGAEANAAPVTAPAEVQTDAPAVAAPAPLPKKAAPLVVEKKAPAPVAAEPAPQQAAAEQPQAVEPAQSEQAAAPEAPATSGNNDTVASEESSEPAEGGGKLGGRLAELLDNVNSGDLKLDNVLKRENGRCKLDLPWVKLNFNCER